MRTSILVVLVAVGWGTVSRISYSIMCRFHQYFTSPFFVRKKIAQFFLAKFCDDSIKLWRKGFGKKKYFRTKYVRVKCRGNWLKISSSTIVGGKDDRENCLHFAKPFETGTLREFDSFQSHRFGRRQDQRNRSVQEHDGRVRQSDLVREVVLMRQQRETRMGLGWTMTQQKFQSVSRWTRVWTAMLKRLW